jgi:hypothetical protein
MAVQELSDLEEIDVSFTYRKTDGSAGAVDLASPPVLTSSDTTAATGVLSADALSAVVRSGDNLPADKPVTFTLDNIGAVGGSTRISITFDMLIKAHLANEITTVDVAFGATRPKS